jgi:hypothetical protein
MNERFEKENTPSPEENGSIEEARLYESKENEYKKNSAKEKREKPDYLTELARLKESGGLDKIIGWIESGTKVWIKRTSGKWQKVEPVETGHGGLTVLVIWDDPDEQRSGLRKLVRSVDLLKWQEEAPGGEDAE